MLLWRLSGQQYAKTFDGGFGLLFDGRWNTAGHAVTYCATSPSLCVLEKLVHIEDPNLLPDLVMVRYEVPDNLDIETITIAELQQSWQLQESWTQQRGDQWHGSMSTLLLRVPSAIIPLDSSPDLNVVINHRHPAVTQIKTLVTEPFVLDARLFQSRSNLIAP
jgi:RES domain-containing protein